MGGEGASESRRVGTEVTRCRMPGFPPPWASLCLYMDDTLRFQSLILGALECIQLATSSLSIRLLTLFPSGLHVKNYSQVNSPFDLVSLLSLSLRVCLITQTLGRPHPLCWTGTSRLTQEPPKLSQRGCLQSGPCLEEPKTTLNLYMCISRERKKKWSPYRITLPQLL